MPTRIYAPASERLLDEKSIIGRNTLKKAYGVRHRYMFTVEKIYNTDKIMARLLLIDIILRSHPCSLKIFKGLLYIYKVL